MRLAVSVCMATYNGAAYLEQQLRSILAELREDDEVVVVDDCSKDDTLQIVQELADVRIRVYRNQSNLGAEASFDRAIQLARRDVVFMADQDDVWIPGRVELMARALERSGKLVVSSNADYVDAAGRPTTFPVNPLRASDSGRHVRNIAAVFGGTAAYYGCAMAFQRRGIALFCPIPSYVESHDLWIALAGNLAGSNIHLEESTLRRRIHGSNASVVRRSLAKKLRARLLFAASLVHLAYRRLSRAPQLRAALGTATAEVSS